MQADQRSQCKYVASQCACFNLRKVARLVTQIFDRHLAEYGLKSTQFTLLVATALGRSASLTRLSQALAMDRTTVTRNLRPLAKEGLVWIGLGSNMRTRSVTLTAKGEALLQLGIEPWQRAQGEIVLAFGEDRWGRLLADLNQMGEAVNALKSQGISSKPGGTARALSGTNILSSRLQ